MDTELNVKDSNRTSLNEGDSVQLIKEANSTLKCNFCQ